MFDLGRIAGSPSKYAACLAAFFVLGTAVHALDESVWFRLAAVEIGLPLVCLTAAFLLAAGRPRCRLLLAAAAVFLLALARYDLAAAGVLRPSELPADARQFTGTVAAEPETGLSGTVLIMDRVLLSGRGMPLAGSFRLTFKFPLAPRYGDVLSWHCRPRPTAGSGPSGDDLLRQGVAWQCAPDKPPRIIAAGPAGGFRGLLFGFKDGLRRLAGRLLPEPEASFLLGLLIGERQGLPRELADSFRRTGTSHILAISGYNVTQLVDVVFILCACAALRRRRAALVVTLFLLVFVAVVGGEASVIRAAVMGGVGLAAAVCGRRYNGLGALLIAAAVMLAADPFSLRHDAGFQLSFTAVWGLRAFGPAFTGRLKFLPEALGLRRTLGETLAATLATAPVILQVFGRLPFVGPLANLLILPLVPWAMAAGAVSLLAGAAWPALGLIPAWFTDLILRLIEGSARWSAALFPYALEMNVGPVAAAVLYGWIILLWFALNRVKPAVLVRRPNIDDIDIEVIDHDQYE